MQLAPLLLLPVFKLLLTLFKLQTSPRQLLLWQPTTLLQLLRPLLRPLLLLPLPLLTLPLLA